MNCYFRGPEGFTNGACFQICSLPDKQGNKERKRKKDRERNWKKEKEREIKRKKEEERDRKTKRNKETERIHYSKEGESELE